MFDAAASKWSVDWGVGFSFRLSREDEEGEEGDVPLFVSENSDLEPWQFKALQPEEKIVGLSSLGTVILCATTSCQGSSTSCLCTFAR